MIPKSFLKKGVSHLKNTLKLILPGTAAVAIILMLFLFRNEAAEGVYEAMTVSVSSLIPSLFPMMALSSFVAESSAAAVLCHLASPFTRYCLKLPERAFLPFLLGLFCGYPVGAAISARQLEKGEISENEAGRLLLFTLNPGIAFTVIFIPRLSGDMRMGWILFTSLTLSSIILAFISGIGLRVPQAELTKPPEIHRDFFSELKNSVEGAGKACLKMCLYIILFSALYAVSEAALRLTPGIPENFLIMLRGSFEVTAGVNAWMKSRLSGSVLLFFLSFGGISLHCQNFSFFKIKPIKTGKFLLFRLLHYSLSVLIYQLLIYLFKPCAEVFSAFSRPVYSGIRGNILSSVFMMLMFLCLVMSLRADRKELVENEGKL